MTKKEKPESASKEILVLEYDLLSLPSAQHKAGLAGLLLMIESMKERKMSPLPEIKEVTSTSARIEFSRESLLKLFNDFYDAQMIEVKSRKKWKNKNKQEIEPLRTEERTETQLNGKTKTLKLYIYPGVQPKGQFLESFFPDGDGVWLKLWRDMLWNTLRGKPTSRNVYEERAMDRPSSVAEALWKDLLRAQQERTQGKLRTGGIVSSLFIGAQDENAERVAFQGLIEHNLLLHFWTIGSLVFVPRKVSFEGDIMDFGYALAIPEPSDLKTYIDDTRSLLRSLPTEMSGFRPREAVITIPEEGGLEYLHHFSRARVAKEEVAYSISAIETYHLQKDGNSIRLLGSERFAPDIRVLQNYEGFRRTLHNPFFRSFRIRNLLTRKPWWVGLDEILERLPFAYFVQGTNTTQKIPFFGLDIKKHYKDLEYNLTFIQENSSMSDEQKDDLLALRIFNLIREYTNRRTEERSGQKFKELKRDDHGKVQYTQEYKDAREKVCKDAFLAMRSRRDQDFIEYFSGTICSVPQWLPEQDYLAVTEALMVDPDKIKTLAMISLSACSYVGGHNKDQGNQQ